MSQNECSLSSDASTLAARVASSVPGSCSRNERPAYPERFSTAPQATSVSINRHARARGAHRAHEGDRRAQLEVVEQPAADDHVEAAQAVPVERAHVGDLDGQTLERVTVAQGGDRRGVLLAALDRDDGGPSQGELGGDHPVAGAEVEHAQPVPVAADQVAHRLCQRADAGRALVSL